jgi:hypothetical protein
MERQATCCDLPRQRKLLGVFVIVAFKLSSNVCAFVTAITLMHRARTTNACAFVWPVSLELERPTFGCDFIIEPINMTRGRRHFAGTDSDKFFGEPEGTKFPIYKN